MPKLKWPGSPTTPVPEPNSGSINWKKIKADFFAQNLDPMRAKDFTFKDVALKYDLVYDTVRKRAVKEKWNFYLKKLQDKIQASTEKKMVESFTITEVELRLRQQRVSSSMIEKAFAALEAIDPTTISTKDATNLMRLGLTQEREAVGLAQKIDFQNLGQGGERDHESPLEKMAQANRMNQLADSLTQLLSEDDEAESETDEG